MLRSVLLTLPVLLFTAATASAEAWSVVNSCAATSRSYHTMVYDSIGNKVYMFGGIQEGTSNQPTVVFGDLWEYDPVTYSWRELFPAGARPEARAAHTMVFDPVRRKLILFGGYRGANTGNPYLSDMWEFDPVTGAWTQVFYSGFNSPFARSSHTMVYDTNRNKLLLYGGYNSNFDILDDLWEFDPVTRTWRVLRQFLANFDGPGQRNAHSMAFNPGTGEAYIFGGLGNGVYNDLWTYNPVLDTWRNVLTFGSLPQPRLATQSVAWDPTENRLLLFGGSDYSFQFFSDTWEFLPGQNRWQAVPIISSIPSSRAYNAMVVLNDGSAVMFGGANSLGASFGDTYLLSDTPITIPQVTCTPTPDPFATPPPPPTWTPTPSPSPVPSDTPTATPIPSDTPTPTFTLTPSLTPTPSPPPTFTRTPSPTPDRFVSKLAVEIDALWVERDVVVTLRTVNTTNFDREMIIYAAVEIAGTFYFLPGFTEQAVVFEETVLPANFEPGPRQIARIPIPNPIAPTIASTWYAVIIDKPTGQPAAPISESFLELD